MKLSGGCNKLELPTSLQHFSTDARNADIAGEVTDKEESKFSSMKEENHSEIFSSFSSASNSLGERFGKYSINFPLVSVLTMSLSSDM